MRAQNSRQNRQRAVSLDAKPFRVLREHHYTAGEHQQTDYLEQHQKVIFIGHGSDEAIRVPEVAFD